MMPVRHLRSYPHHPDPLTGTCNRIALLVASGQPTYPLYVWWIVGGDWWVACWTFLSTPFFLAVPAVSRRNALTGRALLPASGIANGVLATKAFGEGSAVELFLIPCALLAVLGIRRPEWPVAGALMLGVLGALCLHGHYGVPLGQFELSRTAAFVHLNATNAGVLSLVIVWSLIRARRSSARPENRPLPPSP